ncbi:MULTISPECIES: SulP family inorganic anion transporter [unclassified Corallococcus]|uniref:SulP family inorganic anion transporter n=1 Tax=unclassified Corallococcus TaxID=2685029 RepID=UPI001A8C6A54|nr:MULTISPECIES: sulfate permease [unclassified Corallococcus]MBN9682979.1 sulfate permease [Corallococcus sp. NCSPR001]WAS85485.1 sulfate permease [Corallococcus sp. NCRR]
MKHTAATAAHVLGRFLPGVEQARTYERRWLRADVLSALTVGAMLIPQGLAYAQIVGVRPAAGLYAGVFAMLAYALFGPSRHLLLGPEAGAAILTATALGPMVAGGGPERLASLAALLALMVGVVSLLGGLFRAGALADFLSRPILIGYINGAALIIIGSQLARMFGLERRSNAFAGQLHEVAANVGRTHVPTLVLGLAIVAALVAMRRFLPRWPAPLVMVALTTLATWAFQLEHGGVKVVGPIAAAPPSFGLPSLRFDDVRTLLPAAFSLALVNYAGSVLTGRIYADRFGYRLNADQEFFGQAAANLLTGLTQGFPVTGSDSRTAVNASMKGRTQLVGVGAAGVVLLFSLFLTPLLSKLPLVTLGAIVIVAAVYLLEVKPVLRLWRVRPVEAVLAVVTMLGVLFLGILQGILIAVALALVDLIRRAAHPHDAVLGEREGMPGWHDVEGHADAETIPGLVVYRFDAPLFFANARFLREQVRRLVAESRHPVRWFVLDASSVFDLDITAAESLEKVRHELTDEGLVFAVAQARAPMRRMLKRSGLAARIGEDRLFPTVGAAVRAYLESRDDARTAGSGEPAASPRVH